MSKLVPPKVGDQCERNHVTTYLFGLNFATRGPSSFKNINPVLSDARITNQVDRVTDAI